IRLVGIPVRVAGQAKAEGRFSHLRCLSGRMEESTSATLSREHAVVSNRDARFANGAATAPRRQTMDTR
ncbi:MAG: hypothetical protein WA895_11450, partial [Streptosporangiaceae bacterium]